MLSYDYASIDFFFVCSQVKDLNDPIESVEDMPPTMRSLTSSRVSICRGTTSKTTRGKKRKRTLLRRTDVQALVGASMEGISSEMIGVQIEAGLREMIMQGISRMPHHQIKPIEGVSGASEMEHVQHEAKFHKTN